MKNIIRIVCIVFAAVEVMSCQKETDIPAEQTDFMNKTEYGVYSESGDLFVYSESTCQLYYSPTKHSGRVVKDDLSAYFTVTFSGEISSGSTVKGSILTKGIPSAGGFQDYDLKVLKVEDGKAWVWYDRRNIGYLVPWGI